MPHETRLGTYLATDDPARLDVGAIHAYLTRSYWSPGIAREKVAAAVRNSLCLGLYAADGAQVGLMRVVTDRATFAYLCDVYVLEEHRGQGLARGALDWLLRHPDLSGLRRWLLVTRDAHALYTPAGFRALDRPERHLEKVAARPAPPA